MATVLPELTTEGIAAIESLAERRLYVAFRDLLPASWLVLHSVPWLFEDRSHPTDAESDFLIFHPSLGILVLEVKGGGIEIDGVTGDWYTINRNQVKSRIKNPYEQARRGVHQFVRELKDAGVIQDGVAFGYGVVFPDISINGRLSREADPRYTGDRRVRDAPEQWIEGVLSFWIGSRSPKPLTPTAISRIERHFGDRITVRPLLVDELADEEARRIELTRNQSRLLKALRGRPRSAVAGGAGTGKTLLAAERARELAGEGRRTALLCFNELLGDKLRSAFVGSARVEASTFHSFCLTWINEARRRTGIDFLSRGKGGYPTADYWDVQLPYALSLAIENALEDERYDAIIVDEGQDFKSAFWMPVELFLNDADGIFMVFFDDNQAIYGKRPTDCPIVDEPFHLTANCRNTRFIHTAAYRFYRGSEVEPPDIEGRPVEFVRAETIEEQYRKLAEIVNATVKQGKLDVSDLVVLIPGSEKQALFPYLDMRRPYGKVTWNTSGRETGQSIGVETIGRFKGLESAVVILWGVDGLDIERDREVFYVALSRARSRLFVIGRDETCTAVESGLQG